MSNHSDLFADAGVPLLLEQHADAGRVTWTPKNGTPTAVSAIVGNEQHTEENTSNGRRRIVRRRLTITTDPSGTYGGVADPALNATVAVDGSAYAVEAIKPLGGGVFDAVVVRFESMEISRGNYRQPTYGQPAQL